MFKAAVLLAFIIPFLKAKTINVPIEYNNTLDVYFNFKSNSSIIVTPVSSGLEINVLESGIYSNSSIQTICQALSDGMIIVNVDKSSSNQLITWNANDVYHLIDPNTKKELAYDSVLLQGCGKDPTQTTITLSSTAALTQTGLETYIGIISTHEYKNYTTFIPVNQYTATNGSNKATITGFNRINNTIAVVAPAVVTTTTASSALYTNSSVSSVYTEVETVKSCMNHAMGGCSLVTMTNVVSNGMTYTGKSVLTSLYQSEYETTLLQPVATQTTTSKQNLLSTQISGNSVHASVSPSTVNNKSVHTSLSAISTTQEHSASSTVSTSITDSQSVYTSSSAISTTQEHIASSTVSTSITDSQSVYTSLSAVSTTSSNTDYALTITSSGNNTAADVSTGIVNNESTYLSLSAIASSKTTLIQQVSSNIVSSYSGLISVNTLFDGAANKINALTSFLGLGLLINIIL
ncbi:hypothetical protein FOG48_02204 [Hanseniaspora uvarum]|nr:hypothetical protein FOG48_02204 [Hanseniaspora uvarum]